MEEAAIDGNSEALLRSTKTNPEGKRKLLSKFLNQILLSMAASLGFFAIGLVRGYSSSAVPSMQHLDPYLVDSPDAESWISAIPPLGATVGSLVAGPLLQHLGRKRTLMVSAPLAVLGWGLIGSAKSRGLMLGGRILTGFCAGLAIPSAQIYVSECSAPEVRGILASLPSLFMAAGILLSYILGAWLPWHQLAWASALCPALLLAVLVSLPESPTWLEGRGRHAQARRAARWLKRGSGDAAMNGESVKICANGNADAAASFTDAKTTGDARSSLFRRPVLIPLLISLALLTFQQLSGIDAVVFYTVAIFHSAGSPLNDHLATIIIGIVQLVSNSSSLLIVDRWGRRPLLIASGLLMSASMAALGSYFHLHAQDRASNLGLLPLVSLVVFMVGFSVGYCSIPFLLMGELLPVKQRSAFSSVAGSFNLAAMFVVIKTYPDLKGAVGSQGAFWMYAAVCLSSCVFVWFCVPETKGKTLESIEEYFEMKYMGKKEKTKTEIPLREETIHR